MLPVDKDLRDRCPAAGPLPHFGPLLPVRHDVDFGEVRPAFLQQFPDLALSLVVPREQGSAASLAGYQLEILRDKNRELSRRLQELFANAQENERLAVRTHQLTLALMKQNSAADTARAMAARSSSTPCPCATTRCDRATRCGTPSTASR